MLDAEHGDDGALMQLIIHIPDDLIDPVKGSAPPSW
jgi:hypothetical protein